MSSQELSVCPESTVKYRLGFRLSLALFSRPPQYSAKKNLSIFDGRQSFDSSGLG